MKKLFKLMLAGLMAVSLAACGKTGSKETTIQIWHTFTEGQEKLLNEIAQEYMDAHEGAKIEVHNTGAAKEFQVKVTQSVAEGVGPNLIFEYSSFARSFESGNYLLDFESYWGADYDYASTLSGKELYVEATNFADGKLHIVPVYTAGALLFSNQDIYDQYGQKVPTTWDELKESSKAIYEKSGGKVVGISFDSLTDFAQLLSYQCNNGAIVDLENNTPAFNTDEMLKWVEWWAEGVKAGYFQVAAQAADGYNSGDINNGLIASYVGSSAGMPYLKVANLTVTRVPAMAYDGTSKQAGVIWTRGAIGFDKGDEAQNKLTADFVKYFIEQNERWVIELNGNTPYKAVEQSATYQAHASADKALNALNDQVPYSFIAPAFSAATQLRTELETLLKGAAGADYDAKTALQTAYDNVAKAMKGE